MTETRRQLSSKFHVKVRGPKKGFCAICGVRDRLTRDHVPPRSCENVTDTMVRSFAQVAGSGPTGHPTISQGGAHFRTICTKCNNELLGREYDPSLAAFADEISRYASAAYEKGLWMAESILTWAKPQRVARRGRASPRQQRRRRNLQPPVERSVPGRAALILLRSQCWTSGIDGNLLLGLPISSSSGTQGRG